MKIFGSQVEQWHPTRIPCLIVLVRVASRAECASERTTTKKYPQLVIGFPGRIVVPVILDLDQYRTDRDADTGLFANLADGRLGVRLAGFTAPAGERPFPGAARVDQEQPIAIEDDDVRTRQETT